MISDDIILNVLKTQACLPDLVERVGGLNSATNWSNLLSHGEQQRIAFARLFLQKPKIVFCDEATSAIDETTERALYEHLQETVPTVISIAHRSSLHKYHNLVLKWVDGSRRGRRKQNGNANQWVFTKM